MHERFCAQVHEEKADQYRLDGRDQQGDPIGCPRGRDPATGTMVTPTVTAVSRQQRDQRTSTQSGTKWSTLAGPFQLPLRGQRVPRLVDQV